MNSIYKTLPQPPSKFKDKPKTKPTSQQHEEDGGRARRACFALAREVYPEKTERDRFWKNRKAENSVESRKEFEVLTWTKIEARLRAAKTSYLIRKELLNA